MPFTRRGKWYPDPSTRPDRKHTAGVASAVREAREKAAREQDEWYQSLLDGEEDE